MALLDVYPLFDIEPVKGEGAFIFDKKGNKYLDFYGGHAVISIGHQHPHYVKSLQDQLGKISFYSNSVLNSFQQKVYNLINELAELEGQYDLFMINSGAEANENALKLASMANGRSRFLALEKGFHGRTAAAIQVTHKMKHRTAYGLNREVTFVPMNNMDALEHELSRGDVCAIILEPIQGIGGVNVCTSDYLKAVKAISEKHQTVVIVDEIQCGFARSGKFFAHQYAGIAPDIITMAKGMGNGFPVGGILVKKGLLSVEYGMAGTTFGGNHLACVATIAVAEVIKNENLIENAYQMGEYLRQKMQPFEKVKKVKGRGLMIGLEMDGPVKSLRENLLYDHGVFTGSSSDPNVIRILPPLNISKEHIDHFTHKFKKAINE
jgi:acetylornithine/N-succinyldiaminopimelate aminotransferase